MVATTGAVAGVGWLAFLLFVSSSSSSAGGAGGGLAALVGDTVVVVVADKVAMALPVFTWGREGGSEEDTVGGNVTRSAGSNSAFRNIVQHTDKAAYDSAVRLSLAAIRLSTLRPTEAEACFRAPPSRLDIAVVVAVAGSVV